MDELERLRRIDTLDRPLGSEARTLAIGPWRLVLEGLDADLAADLEHRWGGFLVPPAPAAPRAALRLVDAGAAPWIERGPEGEIYRLEQRGTAQDPLLVSYRFALRRDGPARFRLALVRHGEEPAARAVENGVRMLVARFAAEDGGFAMHAAGVERDGRAYLFAGPSRAGKTTVMGLARPAISLGDDFGLVLPSEAGWVAPSVPFDNTEVAPAAAPATLWPVAGIWRLRQAPQDRVDRPGGAAGVAKLAGCLAAPWTLPDLAGELLEGVTRLVADGLFRELFFTREADLWSLLDGR